MISNRRINWYIGEDLTEQVENSSNHSSVTSLTRLPNAMVNHVTSMVNDIDLWMLTSNTL